MNSGSLAGLIVLITRPSAQQQVYADAIEASGGKAVSIPLIEINPLTETTDIQQLKAKVQKLDSFNLLVFVSTNAAKYGAEWIIDYWPQFPADVSVVAVGPTTARSISTVLGCNVIRSDSGMTSEDLLELPILNDVSGKRIGIVRGKGGRELLAESLRSRGAEVDYLEVYQRAPIHYESDEFYQRLKANSVNVLSVTSSESLGKLLSILGDNKGELSLLPLLVPSSRVAEQAQRAGFGTVIDAQGADESSFIAALESLADKIES